MAFDARRVARDGSRPVEVVRVPTVRTRYVSVPVRELTRAVAESEALAVELAEVLCRIAGNAAPGSLVRRNITTALDAAGNAVVAGARAELDRRERELDRREAWLRDHAKNIER